MSGSVFFLGGDCPGGNYPEGNCPWGVAVRGYCPGGNLPVIVIHSLTNNADMVGSPSIIKVEYRSFICCCGGVVFYNLIT